MMRVVAHYPQQSLNGAQSPLGKVPSQSFSLSWQAKCLHKPQKQSAPEASPSSIRQSACLSWQAKCLHKPQKQSAPVITIIHQAKCLLALLWISKCHQQAMLGIHQLTLPIVRPKSPHMANFHQSPEPNSCFTSEVHIGHCLCNTFQTSDYLRGPHWAIFM